ncbi:hypothetical protein BASA60_010267 [Batrachochytrium salamandrivorans]|nr:hypothetical protein BASA60_010267 [Batrachochytrium salamandrivorans]KAH6577073.1 hypothetical protein BASA62_001071 [Batrachochytrium salamandrivorans]
MALKLMYTLVLGCVLVLGVWANTEKLVIHSPPTSSEAIVDMQPFLNHYHHLRPTLYWPYDTTEPMQIQTFPLSSNETSALMYISVMGIKSASEIRVNWPATDPTEFELNLVCKTIECKDLLVMIRARYDGISVPHGRYLSTEPQDVHKVRFSAGKSSNMGRQCIYHQYHF